MKQIVCLLGIVLLVASCKNNVEYATIKGKIDSNEVKAVYFEYLTDSPFDDSSEDYTATVNDNNSFVIEIPIKRLTTGNLNVGSTNYEIVLLPEDNFFVDISDAKIKYTGKGAEKNNFLFQIMRSNTREQYQLAKNKQEMLPNDFLEYANNYRKSSHETLQKQSKEWKLETEFINYFSAKIEIEYDELVRKYDIFYARQNNSSLDSLDIPSEYRHYDNFTYALNDNKINSYMYVHYITNDIYHVWSKIKEINNDLSMQEAQHIALFDSLTGKTQEYVLAKFIIREFQNKNYDTIAINKFYELNTDDITLEAVKNATDKFLEKQALLGKPLNVEFTETILTDTAGLETTLGNIMAKLKGNVVYVDVWGMNCAPCREAMPYAKELKEKLEDYPVEFLYLSNEEIGKSQWRSVFEATFSKKNHYVLKGRFKARFLEFMEINWVPCYMIIDKNGNLRDYNALRPGQYFNWQIEKELKSIAEE